MITAGTYGKEHHFRSSARLDLLVTMLREHCIEYAADLHARAVFSNHYHMVVTAPSGEPERLRTMLSRLHERSAKAVNRDDGITGRKVWYQFWDTALTYERSYLARMNYVISNPVRHGLVKDATAYPWCSAGWFEQSARPAFLKTVLAIRSDRVNVVDPYEPVMSAD
jgi:putative transposase